MNNMANKRLRGVRLVRFPTKKGPVSFRASTKKKASSNRKSSR